jgi:hypothetical protein
MNDNTLAWATEGDDFSSIDLWGNLLGQLYDNTLAWAIEGDDFSSIDLWGSLLGQSCTTSN